MSYIKPDYDYNPLDRMLTPREDETVSPSKIYEAKTSLIDVLKQFSKEIPENDLYHFYRNTSISFRTSVNVLDSVSFYKKFIDSYIFSIKKTFPELSVEKLKILEEKMLELQKFVAEILKDSNVQNKYLLAMSLGILESLLDYENY